MYLTTLYNKQRGLCFLCGKFMDAHRAYKNLNNQFTNGYTLDHLIPISKGGTNGGRNLVLAHAKCNSIKGNRMPTEDELLKRDAIYRNKTQQMGKWFNKM